MTVVANGLAGTGALVAWRRPGLRGRWLWVATAFAEAALVLQVVAGAVLEASARYAAARLHLFYGFVGFVAVTVAYSSRDAMRGRLELLYGLVGLFLMGVAIRTWLQAP